MKIKIAIMLLIGLSTTGFAQDWDNYQPLKSEGLIPVDFTEAYSNKYERQRQRIDENADRKTRQRQDHFHLRSEYFVDEFLLSGDVIFGDTISEYCTRILDLLLKDDGALRGDLRIYVIKSPVVNAFATSNGTIFITLGLMAQVEDEAQLAYVITHEMIHYKNEHVIDQYIEEEKIRNGEDLYQKSNKDDKLIAMSTYSKSHELEADKQGFNLYFKNSGYTHRAPIFLMDVLQYSYLPFDEIKFDPTYLQTTDFAIPDSYLLESTAAITAEADYDDSKSSHPNIKTRKLEILKELDPANKGARFLISEATFMHCQRLARYEISRLYLNEGKYAEAIYNTFLLEQKYGTDKYQQLTLAKALNSASVYLNERLLYKMMGNWEDIEGESQQVYHLLSKFEREDLNTLSVAYSYEMLKNYPDDKAVKRLFRKSLHDLVYENELMPDDFQGIAPDSSIMDLFTLTDSTDRIKRSSKITRIKRKKAEEEIVLSEEEYFKTAFAHYFADSLFRESFAEIAERFHSESNDGDYTGKREKYDPNYSLGIDKMVCVSPEYMKLDERQKDGIKYLSTEEGQEAYRQELMAISNQINLKTLMLDYKNIQPDEVDKFNDISLLKSWINERLMHENTGVINSNFNYMDELRTKYGTDYFAYTGNLSLRVKEQNVAGRLIYSAVVYPMLPYTIATLLIPDYKSFNYFFLFDISNGDALLAEYNNYATNDSKDYLRSILYNHLIQVKAKY